MRLLVLAAVLAAFTLPVQGDDAPKQAPKVVLKSPDGKTSYDLAKLVEKGPVLVRLTCACTGCDAELPFFQKLQAAYNKEGLQTIAVFREKPEAAENYVVKKDIKFMYLSDPAGALWKTFDAKTMPTNILIGKGGTVIRMVSGCTTDGRNAQAISDEVAKLLQVTAAKVGAEAKKK